VTAETLVARKAKEAMIVSIVRSGGSIEPGGSVLWRCAFQGIGFCRRGDVFRFNLVL
jgi:hypothetical protein